MEIQKQLFNTFFASNSDLLEVLQNRDDMPDPIKDAMELQFPENSAAASRQLSILRMIEGLSAEDLSNSESLILAALDTGETYDFLNAEEIKEELAAPNEKLSDAVRLAYTLSATLDTDDAEEFLPVALEYLRRYDSSKPIEFSQAVTHCLILYNAWLQFSFLNEDDQSLLLEKFFLSSSAAGVPVKDALARAAYEESLDIVGYVTYCLRLNESLEKNTEKVSEMTFGEILAQIDIHEKVESILQNHNNIFGEAFAIAQSVRRIELLNSLRYEEKNNSDEYLFEMVKLVALFVFNVWEDIVSYFQSRDKKVTMTAFLYQLVTHDHLENQDQIEKYLNFFDVLKKNKLLVSEEELLVYDIKKNQFVFNTDWIADYGNTKNNSR